MKMNVNVIAEALKNCERDGDMVEIPQSVARGFMHMAIRSEILDLINTDFPTKVLSYEDCQKIIKVTNRNSQQVYYYLNELREDGIIKIKESPKTYKSVIIGNKIANYLEENSSTDINIYVLAKALDITVSTIHACVDYIAELRVRDCNSYDDRGRKIYRVEWRSDRSKKEFRNSGTVTRRW
jgi:DNA-binding PadR family transcriptional regulator